jgi:putative tryptophan/tyrosine transport system substrate-binding protein
MRINHLGRRDFITLLGGAAAAWPVAARAQKRSNSQRIGITSIQPRSSPPYVAFDQRLRELGYIEGQDLAVEFLNPAALAEGMAGAMKELVRRKVDGIVAPYESALKSALAASDTTPIVMLAITYDPLALGYIKSLARPGGNVTGLFTQQLELAVKCLELLKDAIPELRAATVFWDRDSADQWKATEEAATTVGLRVAGIELREQPYDYERALTQAPPDHRSALFTLTSPLFYRDRQRLADLALRKRMASMFVLREWVEAGGLLSYGVNFPALFRRAAEYVDKILRGTKPAELPVEQPTRFELAVNLKTAKTLGLAISETFLVRADEVIE